MGKKGTFSLTVEFQAINVKGMMEIKNHHNNDHLGKYHQSILKLGMGTRWADKRDF